ncbi:MAG: SNF2-related protein [Bacteroidota bacterium]
MALPHIIKFIYNHGTEEVVRRGKKIHAIGYADMVEHDDLTGRVVFRVRDDIYSTFYKIQIQKYKDEKNINIRCSCPYNLGDICRHEVASLFQLQDLVEQGIIGSDARIYNQKHTVIKMKHIELKTIRMLTGPDTLNKAEDFLRTQRAKILEAKDEQVVAEVGIRKETFKVILHKNEERHFDTSCNCSENKHAICVHKAIVFIQLLNLYGIQYFDSIRNPDKEKAKLLGIYGYKLSDKWQEKFEFIYKEGKPFLRLLDPDIKRLDTPIESQKIKRTDTLVAEETAPVEKKSLGIVINANLQKIPFFSLELISGEKDEDSGHFVGLIEKQEINTLANDVEENEKLIKLIKKFDASEIEKFLKRNSPFGNIWDNIIVDETEAPDENTFSLYAEYLIPKLKTLINETDVPLYFLPKGKSFVTKNLLPANAGSVLQPGFELYKEKGRWIWRPMVKINGAPVGFDDNESGSPFIFFFNGTVRTWDKKEDLVSTLGFINKSKQTITEKDLPDFLEKTFIPYTQEHSVEFDPSLIKATKEADPEFSLRLLEKGEYLVLQPSFSYKGYVIKATDKKEIMVAKDDGIMIIKRNPEKERKYISKIESLHSQFVHLDGGTQLALRGSEVLRNNWFFLFVDALKEMKVVVEGWDVLKKFRFNTEKPKTNIYISNGVDWFDAKVDIRFGEQQVSVNEIKKAIQNKQSFVQLDDGSMGVLPEEWLKKYGLLFRVGEKQKDQLRLSKYHINIIDVLYEQRDEEEIMIELDEKMEKLKEFREIEKIEPPSSLKNILRPYQTGGFQWLHFLHQIGWGGILADDMGLGKTIQALSFILHLYQQNSAVRALVVCPTTLAYNWENEIKKFAPELTYIIHHGGQRTRDLHTYKNTNVIITTYGTLRSDIKIFCEANFDYIVLDESQAIKNPGSKVAKAVCLLKSTHRLCMSGTPLQNNTFDIYAQMNFLNPGLLGSMDHFRNTFSTPIDKFGEQEQKEDLKKIIYPFILRRAKEQVAKDLPEKTETILFCEMEEEQKTIYESFRNEYRAKILGTIDEVGIRNSQFTILQGLMKLRQICDSPSILKNEGLPNTSIKLDELSRELTENIGKNKALVFSQFLGMLALIKEKLKALQIPFVYFDGSTSVQEREKAVNEFQTNPDIKVFLISLKAGGVGLNLTAASYVYIVDPWWNPAVEQQAIDRTHRIGQTNNIFAYRMICKDTIEDKIIQLQEKKRTLAKELVSDDDHFVKSLSKEDVEFLFS